jgi:hypothetical protein
MLLSSFCQSQIINNANPASLYTYQIIAQSLASLVLTLLYQPLQSACAIMAYFDLRVRLEGFDLAMMANQSSQQPLAVFEAAGQAPAGKTTGLVTWPEMGYFAVISLIGVLLYFLVVLIFMLFTVLLMSL